MEYLDDDPPPFFEFVKNYDTTAYQSDFTHLQDYLAAWLESGDTGNAIRYTGRNYETWLRTIIHIADAVFSDPSILNFNGALRTDAEVEAATSTEDMYAVQPYERRIVGIRDPGRNSSLVFDRHYYEYVAYEQERPRPHLE
jgi:hypothetical protein